MPARRDKGTGTVFRRPDGRWVAACEVAPLAGQTAQRPRLTRTGRTRAEAQAALRRAQQDRARALRPAAGLTVAAYLEQWLADVVAPVRRPGTVRVYRATIARYLLPPLGRLLLAELGPRDLQAVYATMQRAGLHCSAKLCHAILHAALAAAVRLELLDRNPADRTLPPAYAPPRQRALSAAQAKILLTGLKDHPDEALYLVALTTGLRAGELLGLGWAALDLAAGRLDVARQVQWRDGRWWLDPPKSRPRGVLLLGFVVAALRRHETRQALARELAGPDWEEHGLLFPNATGRPQHSRAVRQRWARLTVRLGLPRLTLHELRHSFASLARAAGVDLAVTQEMLGHARATLTLEVYTHVDDAQRRAGLARLEELLGG